VHVDDVVDGLVAAGDRGATGAVYVLNGEGMDVNAFADFVARLGGRGRAPRLRFPKPLALATAALLDVVARLTGARFPLSRESVRTGAGGRWLHSDARARAELGWAPRPLLEGLPPVVESLRQQMAADGRD
jgi:dihydroflavonol-4-reductase